MKRRSQKRVVRDREMEQVRAMTHLSLTEREVHDRLIADKIALEVRLRELFQFRRDVQRMDPDGLVADSIKRISNELRRIKAQLT